MSVPPNFRKNMFHLAATAIHVSFSILSGGLLGYYFDSLWQTQPIFLFVGLILGGISATFAVKKLVSRMRI